MLMKHQPARTLNFMRWIPLAKKVVHQSLGLGWNDVVEIYSYIPTIPLAEALAIEARRTGSDTHITLMTDDLWFTSMQELSHRWLKTPSDVELAINRAVTAEIYLGGPRDVRRMRDIPPEKFRANTMGNIKQDEPKRKRNVRSVDLPIGRLCPERAEAYGLDYERWEKSYNAALAVDLQKIRKAGERWYRKLRVTKGIKITSDTGTGLRFKTRACQPMVEDGIISASDVRRGFLETSLPAGKIVSAVVPDSVEGVVHFADPVFLMGRSVKGLLINFEKGRLSHWEADEHSELLVHLLHDQKNRRNQMGWFTIGLNSAAEPCMLDNSIVLNGVGIGLGPHPLLEPLKARPDIQFYSTIGLADVELLD